MKKALSLILALVLCLSLCACGNNHQAAPTQNSDDADAFLFRQKWKQVDKGKSLVFLDSTLCNYDSKEYKYEYNQSLEIISIYFTETLNLNVVQENDSYILKSDDSLFVPVEQYDSYRAEYIKEWKQKEVGDMETYSFGSELTEDSDSLISEKIEKVEFIDGDNKKTLIVYIACINNSDDTYEDYVNYYSVPLFIMLNWELPKGGGMTASLAGTEIAPHSQGTVTATFELKIDNEEFSDIGTLGVIRIMNGYRYMYIDLDTVITSVDD